MLGIMPAFMGIELANIEPTLFDIIPGLMPCGPRTEPTHEKTVSVWSFGYAMVINFANAHTRDTHTHKNDATYTQSWVSATCDRHASVPHKKV